MLARHWRSTLILVCIPADSQATSCGKCRGAIPAIGFINRRGYRLHRSSKPQSVDPAVLPETDLNLTYNLDGVLETRRLDFQLLRVELQSSDMFEFHLLPLFEWLPRNFEVFSSVILPAGGQYSFLRRHYQVSSRRSLTSEKHQSLHRMSLAVSRVPSRPIRNKSKFGMPRSCCRYRRQT